jgi:regulator of RNase E activity RraA
MTTFTASRAKVVGTAGVGVVIGGRFRDIGEIQGTGLPLSFAVQE